MTNSPFSITPELPKHFDDIDTLTQLIFGPGMFARAAYRLREGIMPEADLSFVATEGTRIIGTVRQTRILIGDRPALLLGPLGVLPDHNNKGIGKALMQRAISAAKDNSTASKAEVILLVGDHAYYAPFGFKQAAAEKISMPRPVDIGRTLVLELREGALANISGEVLRWR